MRGGELAAALGNIVGQVALGLVAFWAAVVLMQATGRGAAGMALTGEGVLLRIFIGEADRIAGGR